MMPQEDERHVFVSQADNMSLPFPDSYFDCYVSNLSLMIVPSYKLQIAECFRVLKPNSSACFSVWGRPERCLQFQAVNFVNERLGKPQTVLSSNFNIQANIEDVKQAFISAGFN
jgi:ubiquinone/menaquinone biosynthesis C-methylase UbiE